MKWQPPDSHYLAAAQGWLELGDPVSASNELDEITPQMRAHPDVLQVRCKIYGDAQKWEYAAAVANALCRMLPDSVFGPLYLAHALRRLDRIQEARDALQPVADKFPDEWRIPYSLACYSCRLDEHKEAMRWLELAIDVAGKTDLRMKALEEPDLEPLRLDIAEI